MPPGEEGGLAGPAADNIRAIVDLERRADRETAWTDRLSERITRIIGTLAFVVGQAIVMAVWLGWNLVAPAAWRFDPWPFGLLTFFVSMEGVFIAAFVLIAQNRMSRQTDYRDHLTLQVDLLAEQEMTLMLRMLRRIADHLQLPPEDADASAAEQLTRETNVYELMQTIERELPDGPARD